MAANRSHIHICVETIILLGPLVGTAIHACEFGYHMGSPATEQSQLVFELDPLLAIVELPSSFAT
jgi:hypothetical protein